MICGHRCLQKQKNANAVERLHAELTQQYIAVSVAMLFRVMKALEDNP